MKCERFIVIFLGVMCLFWECSEKGAPVNTELGGGDKPGKSARVGGGSRNGKLDSRKSPRESRASTDELNLPVKVKTSAQKPVLAPMPLISRGVPHFASSGMSRHANDDSYSTFWMTEDNDFPAWLAYDLSRVPVKQRGRVLVHWINDSYSYYSPTGGIIRCPSVYRIDGHKGRGGSKPPAPKDKGWKTLAAVKTPYTHHSRQHVVNLTEGETVYNWIRLYVTKVNGDNMKVNLNVDVHDAHLGVEDSWYFFGDSLTAGAMSPIERKDKNFAQIVNEALPQYFPAQENAGVGGWTSKEGAEYLPKWLNHFPGRYVAISFGTNDADGGDRKTFYTNYEAMVQTVLKAKKIPIIPTIPWVKQKRAERIRVFNEALRELKNAYPQILDGPDFWTFFSKNPHLIASDGLHPKEPEGDHAYRRLWAEKMLSVVYGR